MPSQDYIKGKADIFYFVLEVLNGVRRNGRAITCGEIVDRIEHYVSVPLRDSSTASAEYNAGVGEALAHFRGYYVPREDIIDSEKARHIYNAVEERFEQLWRQLWRQL
jgi:hypothetical protein